MTGTKRLALVTGGAAGIGAAIARRMMEEGANVVILDVSKERAISFSKETGIVARICDVSCFEEVENALKSIEDELGPIGILINNAGITRDGMVHKLSRHQWDEVIDVNLSAAFNTIRCLSPLMRERGWGRIINISSMTGQRGTIGQANYAAAKAGMIGFTKTIALELASRGVTANCIAPGFILTDMTMAMRPELLDCERTNIPVNRLGKPEDIAHAAAFLASENASFITGQVIAINGGQYM
jgi:acetoacetyl-CoA reductase